MFLIMGNMPCLVVSNVKKIQTFPIKKNRGKQSVSSLFHSDYLYRNSPVIIVHCGKYSSRMCSCWDTKEKSKAACNIELQVCTVYSNTYHSSYSKGIQHTQQIHLTANVSGVITYMQKLTQQVAQLYVYTLTFHHNTPQVVMYIRGLLQQRILLRIV